MYKIQMGSTPVPYFFFFQAEDGIRDLYVTGVQTCALPILKARRRNRTVVARNPFSRFAMRRLAFSLLAIVLIGVLPAFAQEAPPARVGRVSFVSGQLGFHLAGETAWSAAKVNYPVATGGSFWTDPKSRAELRIGSRTISFAGDTVL